jgi:hypothetical protein
MSMSNAIAASVSNVSPAATAGRARDHRLDFFRGLALMMIFIDHVAGNQVAALTMRAFGFADAAEVFVFIAGMAGVYAYRSAVLNKGLAAGAALVFARIRTLYLAHLLMTGGVLLFAMAVMISGSGFDVVGKLGLQALLNDPATAITRLPVLAYMPHYLDILPLYIVLLAMLPGIIVGMRLHPLLPSAVLFVVYTLAHGLGLTLPNFGQAGGWFLNPFAWGLLFALGAATAELSVRGSWALLRRPLVALVTAAAAAFVVFSFLHAAPWQAVPALSGVVALEWALQPDKALLSWHRLADILAKVWLVAVMVPRQAAFMTAGFGGALSRAGRHSLPVFVAGVMLSLVASIILYESDGAAIWHVAVSAGGVMLMLAMARLLDGPQALGRPAQILRARTGVSA